MIFRGITSAQCIPVLPGDKVVQMNIDGVDASVSGIIECPVPASWAEISVPGEAGPGGGKVGKMGAEPEDKGYKNTVKAI